MSKETLNLITHEISKGMLDGGSLRPIIEHDSDFLENEEYYREDTLKLGFDNEADRVSVEINAKYLTVDDESERINSMVSELFEVINFIGISSHYGTYEYRVLETEFTYIIVIAYLTL